MIFFLRFVGIVSGLTGLALLLAPKALAKFNEFMNKTFLDVDAALQNRRVALGVSLCIASAVILIAINCMLQKACAR